MRLINVSGADHAEWMAPDTVVQRVMRNYLESMEWLHDNALSKTDFGLHGGTVLHFTEAYYRQFQALLVQRRRYRNGLFNEVFRADHHLTVRQFSEDGSYCLLIDEQTNCRMATYDRDKQRVSTQDVGDRTVVYGMQYAPILRWKIDKFIQELPIGWHQLRTSQYIEELAEMPPMVGRDN